MTRRFAALAVVLLLTLPAVAGKFVVFNATASAPATPFHFLDDFSTDTSANWSQYGSMSLTIGSGVMVTNAATGSAIYNVSAMGTAAGYICYTISGTDGYGGMKFRASSNDSTSSYIFRCNSGSGVAWRLCDGSAGGGVAACQDLYLDGTVSCSSSFAMGIVYSGTGSGTTVDYYTFSDGVCPNCTGSDCDTSTWAAAAYAAGQFTNPGAAGLCTGLETPYDGCLNSGALKSYMDTQRYIGVYNGNSTAVEFNNYYAGDD